MKRDNKTRRKMAIGNGKRRTKQKHYSNMAKTNIRGEIGQLYEI